MEFNFYSYQFKSGAVVQIGTKIAVDVGEVWEITKITEVKCKDNQLFVNGKAKPVKF